MPLPLLQPSPSETLAERCARLALQIEDYERDVIGNPCLDLTEIRRALEEAAKQLA